MKAVGAQHDRPTNLGKTEDRRVLGADGHDSEQRATGYQQQGAGSVWVALAYQSRRQPDALRRASRSAPGGPGDDLYRTIQRPSPGARRRRAIRPTRWLPRCLRCIPQGTPGATRYSRVRSHLAAGGWTLPAALYGPSG